MSSPPSLPPPFRERLLPTNEDAADRDVADAISRFCASSPEIEAAYVCSTERQREGEDPVTALRLAFKLCKPVDRSADSRQSHHLLLERLMRSEAGLAERLGCGVLADRAVPAWEKHGVRIFAR